MNKRINFLKNPRYVAENPIITIKSIIEKPVNQFLFLLKTFLKGDTSTSEPSRESFSRDSQRSDFYRLYDKLCI